MSDRVAIANELHHHFSNVGNVLASNIDNFDANSFISYLKYSCPSTIFVYPSAYHEIISLISALKLDKSDGHDDIPSYFLKIPAEIIAIPLAMILNLCMQFGIFPNKLKIAKVLPVYKSGPTEHVTNCRPISLLLSISKIFERVILNRLLPFLERNNIITPAQFRFRREHSTLHAMLDLVTACFDNINNKLFSSLIFVDIKKAFDCVSHKKIDQKT